MTNAGLEPVESPFSLRYFWAVLPLACGVAISTLLLHMATDPAAWEAWSGWFPFAMWPVFHDLSVTMQHLHEADLGLDPLANPTSDFAYPRAVLLLRYLGLHSLPNEWLGFFQGILLTLTVVFVVRPQTAWRALGVSVLFFTPPIIFGFERGNLDFVLFMLCVVAAWQWSRSERLGRLFWPVALMSAGAVLKLYPLFAMFGGALAETGRRRQVWLGGIAIVLGYWALNLPELNLVLRKLPIAVEAQWGCLVLFTRVEDFVNLRSDSLGVLAGVSWTSLALPAYALAAAVAAWVGMRLAGRFRSTTIPGTEWAYYWVGALICCGAFAGINYAYRWVFVLLTLPLLLRCVRSPEPAVALWARMALIAVLISLAAPLSSASGVFLFFQAANWSCILLFIVGCVALRVTEKSDVFAFLLRWCAPQRDAAPALGRTTNVPAPDLEPTRGSRGLRRGAAPPGRPATDPGLETP